MFIRKISRICPPTKVRLAPTNEMYSSILEKNSQLHNLVYFIIIFYLGYAGQKLPPSSLGIPG